MNKKKHARTHTAKVTALYSMNVRTVYLNLKLIEAKTESAMKNKNIEINRRLVSNRKGINGSNNDVKQKKAAGNR